LQVTNKVYQSWSYTQPLFNLSNELTASGLIGTGTSTDMTWGSEYTCDTGKWNTTDACLGIDRPWGVNATDPYKLTFFHWLADTVQDRSRIFSVENKDVITILTYERQTPKPINGLTNTVCTAESV